MSCNSGVTSKDETSSSRNYDFNLFQSGVYLLGIITVKLCGRQ